MGFPEPVTVRTTRTTISFSQPFKLRDLDDIQPAGDYLLDTDEELIEGLSRLAYRRVATLLHLPSTVTKLLPPVGAELQYRIKSEGEAHERVATEHELQAMEFEKPIVAAESRSSPVDGNAARIFVGHS
jgi:hypothetical protein